MANHLPLGNQPFILPFSPPRLGAAFVPVQPPANPSNLPLAAASSAVASPRSKISNPSLEILQALQNEGALDDEYAYVNQESTKVQDHEIPAEIIPKYTKLMNSNLVIPIKCFGIAYELRKQAWEQLEWVSAHAAAMGTPIRWVMRGGELAYQLGSSFFKNTLEKQHPEHYEKIQELDCRGLDVPPTDVDFSAKCFYTDEASDVGNSHLLNIVYEHFRSLEFDLRYLNGPKIPRIQGFEAFCQHILQDEHVGRLTFVTVTNRTIPWMYHKEWLGEALSSLIKQIESHREEFAKLSQKTCSVKLGRLFEELTPFLFKMKFSDLKASIEGGFQSPIQPHDVYKKNGEKLFHFYKRVVFFDEHGKEFDFTHFNSYTHNEEMAYKTSQNIYLELPNHPTQAEHVTLFYTEQAILDRACGIFRLFDRINIKDRWPQYCYALTLGEMTPQKNLSEQLRHEFLASRVKEQPIQSMQAALEGLRLRILSRYQDPRAALFSFFFHATRGILKKEDLDLFWSKLFGEPLPLPPLPPDDLAHQTAAFKLALLDVRNFPQEDTLEGILQILALRYIFSSKEAREHAPFRAWLTRQNNAGCVEFKFHSVYIQVPFDPVRALKSFRDYAAVPEHAAHLANLAHAFPLNDFLSSVSPLPDFPAFDHEAWFKELSALVAIPNSYARHLGLTLLHHSLCFAEGKTVFCEALKLSSSFFEVDATMRFRASDWMISMTRHSGLSPKGIQTLTSSLQDAKEKPPARPLYALYLELYRQETYVAPAALQVQDAPSIQETPAPLPQPMAALPQKPKRLHKDKHKPVQPKPAPKSPPKEVAVVPVPAKPAAKSPPKENPTAVAVKPAAEPPLKEVPLTPDARLKRLFEECASGDTPPNFSAILEHCAKASIIPRLEPLLAYFKSKKNLTQPDLEFLHSLYRHFSERSLLKKSKEIYGLLKGNFPAAFGPTEREFWFDMARIQMRSAEPKTTTFELLEDIERLCLEGRESLARVLDEAPLPFVESNPNRYAGLMRKLDASGGAGVAAFIRGKLNENSTASLLCLLEFIVATGTKDPITWGLLFRAIGEAPCELALVQTAFKIGKDVIASLDFTLNPDDWTSAQSFLHRLFFRIYREEPTVDNSRHLQSLWDNLNGPDDNSTYRCYEFVLSLLKALHCQQVDRAMQSRLESWCSLVSSENPDLQSALDYYHGLLVTGQKISLRSGRDEMQNLMRAQAEVLPKLTAAVIQRKDVKHLHLHQIMCSFACTLAVIPAQESAPHLEKLCTYLLERLLVNSTAFNPIAYVHQLARYCQKLTPQETVLRDSLLVIASKFARFGLENQNDPPVAADLLGILELLKLLNEEDKHLQRAYDLIIQIPPQFDISAEAVYVSIIQKMILQAFDSPLLAEMVAGVSQAFSEVEKLILKNMENPTPVQPFATNSLGLLYHKYKLCEARPRSPEQGIIESSILAQLEFYSISVGIMPPQTFAALKTTLDRIFAYIGKGKHELRIDFSRLRTREFLKQLLEVRPSSRDSAWLLIGLCGVLFRVLYEKEAERDPLCALLGKFCMHPSFQYYALERNLMLQNASIQKRIIKSGFAPKIGLVSYNQFRLYLSSEFPARSNQFTALEPNLKKALLKNVIDTLLRTHLGFAVAKAMQILIPYPFEDKTREHTTRMEQIFGTPQIWDLPREDKATLLLEILDFFSLNPALLENTALYNALFERCVQFLEPWEDKALKIFEKLVFFQLSDKSVGTRAIAIRITVQPSDHLIQNMQLGQLLSSYVNMKIGSLLPPFTPDTLEQLNVLLNVTDLVQQHVSRDFLPENSRLQISQIQKQMPSKETHAELTKIRTAYQASFDAEKARLNGFDHINKDP